MVSAELTACYAAADCPIRRSDGKATVTLVPTQSRFRSPGVPPCSSTSSLVSGRPRPVPSYSAVELAVELAERRQRARDVFRRRCRCRCRRPRPRRRRRRCARRRCVTVPPRGVNLTALDSRLSRIWLDARARRRAAIGQVVGDVGGSVTLRSRAVLRPCAAARSTTLVASAVDLFMCSSSGRPRSSTRSRMSLMSVSRCLPLRWMSLGIAA